MEDSSRILQLGRTDSAVLNARTHICHAFLKVHVTADLLFGIFLRKGPTQYGQRGQQRRESLGHASEALKTPRVKLGH